MVITITGDICTGKSSIGKELANRLSLKYFSAGSIYRRLSSRTGLSVLDTFASSSKDIDIKVNELIRRLGHEGNYVIDARTGYKECPNSFKILLKASEDSRNERLKDRGESKEDADRRFKVEKEKFKDLLDTDIANEDNYDLVLYTTGKTVKESVDIILENLKSVNRPKYRLLCNNKNLMNCDDYELRSIAIDIS